MTLAAAMVAVCASAQVYLGGNAGVASIDYGGDDDSETVWSLLPEIGYNFNDELAAGVMFGWSKGQLQGELEYDASLRQTFEINPYVRYTFLSGKLVNVFLDGAFGYKHYNGSGDAYSLGIKPGVALKMDKFSLVAHIGFVGWQSYNPKHGDDSNAWGASFDGNNIMLGLYYNF